MLTNEEIEKLYDSTWDNLSDDEHIYIEFARAIESLVRERTIDECAAELFGQSAVMENSRKRVLALKEKK
jgi:hypothetical protein